MPKEDKEIKDKMVDLRKQILNADDLKTERVFVPEWTDQPLYIRKLTSIERDELERDVVQFNSDGTVEQNMVNFRGKLLVRTLCSDSEGRIRIFTDSDAELIGQKSADAVNKCFSKSKQLSGISEEDQEKLVKN